MLELKNISYIVEGEKEILKDISLTVEDGRFVVITGPNGGGKSTLAKIIAGVILPSSGKIILNGTDITNASVTERANMGIGYAFQQPVRFKGLTVRDLLNLAAGEEKSEARLCSYLRDVGLCAKDYIDREVNASLSGGEIKRIEIATVMARGAKLTLFDEPEAGIDLWSFTNLIEVFRHLREERGGSIVIISHQERIIDIADEIVVLSAGEIAGMGTAEEIMPHILKEGPGCKMCEKREAF